MRIPVATPARSCPPLLAVRIRPSTWKVFPQPEVEAVKGFVAYVRTPEGKRELARAEFERFWNDWKKRAPDMSEKEAEELAREAVAFARGRA